MNMGSLQASSNRVPRMPRGLAAVILLAIGLLGTPLTLAAPADKYLTHEFATAWLDERADRLGERLDRSVADVETYFDASGNPLYRVVRLQPEGFLLMSPDDEIEPVIAFSDSGHYSEHAHNPLTGLVRSDMRERTRRVREPLFQARQQGLATSDAISEQREAATRKWVRYREKAKTKAVPEAKAPRVPAQQPAGEEIAATAGEPSYENASISNVVVTPLLSTKWNQLTSRDSNFAYRNLYNIYTPNNYYSGCVATAIAQVLRFHSFPTSAIGQVSGTVYVDDNPTGRSTRGGDGSGGPYDWSIMIEQPTTQPYDANAWNMIGALMHDAGVAVSMMYTPSGSGAYFSDVPGALTGVFQYANAQRSHFYSVQGLGSEQAKILSSNLHAGYPVLLGIVDTPAWTAHAVVADGYGYDSATLYHHINMGWGGNSDAWYNLPTILSYDITAELIYNIFPSASGELISGRVVDQMGNPRAGMLVRATSQSTSTTYSAVSHANGYYGIVVPPADTYDVTAQGVTVSDIAVGTSTTSATANVADANLTIADAVASDGKTDIVWRNTDSGQILTWLMDGTTAANGLVQGSLWNNMPPEWQIKGMGDFDGDGKDDLLWQHTLNGMVFVWLLDDLSPADQLQQGAIWDVMPPVWVIKAVGDFDGDGKDDILWQNSESGMVFVWCLDGTSTADQITQGSLWDVMPPVWVIKGVGDFDGDGKDDILWQNSDSGMVFVWLLDGTSRADQISQGSIWDTMPKVWVIDRIGDFDGDGKDDILWRHADTGQLIVWLMDGLTRADTLTQGELVSGLPDVWQTTAVGDFDGNGTDDLLWRHQTIGWLLIWFMNGAQSADQLTQATLFTSMPASWQVQVTGHVNGQ